MQMQCYEFNDGGGVTFGIIAVDEEEARKYAEADCEEEVAEYTIEVLTEEQAKERFLLDEETGERKSIFKEIAEYVAGGCTGPAMLWHSEA